METGEKARQLSGRGILGKLIGSSPAMQELFFLLRLLRAVGRDGSECRRLQIVSTDGGAGSSASTRTGIRAGRVPARSRCASAQANTRTGAGSSTARTPA